MGSIEGSDFYGVDGLLTAEEKERRDRVQVFVSDECMPVIADHFDKGTFPMQVIPRWRRWGFWRPCRWIRV